MSAAPTKGELIDLFWRSVWTFVQAFTGSLIAFPVLTLFNVAGMAAIDWTPVSLAVASAAVGGVAQVLAVVKVFSSNKLGTGTAATRSEPVLGPAPTASSYTKILPPPPTGPEVV